jgi:hypothetical protein
MSNGFMMIDPGNFFNLYLLSNLFDIDFYFYLALLNKQYIRMCVHIWDKRR